MYKPIFLPCPNWIKHLHRANSGIFIVLTSPSVPTTVWPYLLPIVYFLIQGASCLSKPQMHVPRISSYSARHDASTSKGPAPHPNPRLVTCRTGGQEKHIQPPKDSNRSSQSSIPNEWIAGSICTLVLCRTYSTLCAGYSYLATKIANNKHWGSRGKGSSAICRLQGSSRTSNLSTRHGDGDALTGCYRPCFIFFLT